LKTSSHRHLHKPNYNLIAFALTSVASACNGFSAFASQANSIRNWDSAVMMLPPTSQNNKVDRVRQNRRSVLSSIFTKTTGFATVASIVFPGVASSEPETLERGGVKLTPFNSLAFNYRGASCTLELS